MMISCPRCGFSQPEDQYCAQCGVNMHAFKPRQKSTFKKLTENVGIQIVILLVFGVGAGSFLIRKSSETGTNQQSEKYSSRSKGAIRTTSISKSAGLSPNANDADNSLQNLKNKEITIDSNSASSLAATQAAFPPPHQAEGSESKSVDAKDGSADSTSGVLFKMTYAEVSREVLQKWIADSSQLGLYQNLQSYSAGILPDFNKRADKVSQYLKTSEKKLMSGQSDSSLSGTVSDDGSQMIGLSVNYDIKLIEAGAVHGSITVLKLNRQSRESYPAEFDLPKGAVFFMVDTLTPQSFLTEKRNLNMSPFQIFKSPDFMSQKTKFVILLEPILK
jgi:hypothetical protein